MNNNPLLQRKISEAPISKKEISTRMANYDNISRNLQNIYSSDKQQYYRNLYSVRQQEIEKVSQILSSSSSNNLNFKKEKDQQSNNDEQKKQKMKACMQNYIKNNY